MTYKDIKKLRDELHKEIDVINIAKYNPNLKYEKKKKLIKLLKPRKKNIIFIIIY